MRFSGDFLLWHGLCTERTVLSVELAMSEILLLLFSTAIINNVVLVKFLGLCPFVGVTKKLETAFGMGLATAFVITMASGACWMLENWILIPFDILYLRILMYILVIAAVVQFVEMVVKKSAPDLYQALGVYLPLITTNCAVLGLPLLIAQEKMSLFHAIVFGFGSSIGFTLVLVMFAGMRERLALSRIPAAFAGAPISFMTASMLALAFMGFSGLNFN
jgi:electron transport complex protein RnfA